jgi:autotransporter-associated beta strand protein
MSSRLHRLLHRLAPRRRAPRGLDLRRPALEALETRLAPATDTWTGAGAVASLAHPNPNWTNPQNWQSGVAPQPGDALVFPAAPTAKTRLANNDYKAGTGFASITINGDGYQITGNAVVLSGGISNTFGYASVSLPLTLSAAQTFSDAKGSFLELSGSINNGGHLLTLNSNSGNILFDGTSITGAGGLTVAGNNYSGNVYLENSTPDSYTGATTVVNAGVLYLDGAEGSSVVGNLVVGTGPGPVQNDVVRLAGPNEVAATSNVTVLADGLFDLNGYTDTIGSLTMCGGYVITGTGMLTLGGNVTTQPSPTTAVIEGSLSLGNGTTPRIFTVASGSSGVDLSLRAAISGGSGVQMVKAGTGTMWLTEADTFFGPTLVSAGTLVATNANALGTSPTTVAGGATVIFKDTSADSSFTFANNPMVLNGGTLEVNSNSSAVVFPGVLTLAAPSTIEVNTGNTLDLTGQVSGSGGFTKAWAGELDLDHANTTSGAVTVNEGVLALDNSQALGSSAVKVSGQATLTLENGLSYGESLTLAGTLFSNCSATWGGTVNLIGSATLGAPTGSTLTVSGVISGAAANTLTINDAGTVLLTAANTYAGATVVSDGTLAIANPNALGAGSAHATNGTTVDAGATLQLRGGLTFDKTDALTINGFGVNGAGAFQDGSGNDTWAGTIALASNTAIGAVPGTTLTIGGIISGGYNSNVSYVGGGTVVLAAADAYQGYSTVAAGILALDNANALSGAPINGGRATGVDSGATLLLEAGVSYALDPLLLSGAGVNGMGALVSQSGNNTWIGPVKLSADTTIASAAGSTLTIDAPVTNQGYTLTVNAVGNVDLGGVISGPGGLVKNGPGTLTLSGPGLILYSGPTVVNAGTLLLAKSPHVPAISGAGLTINAGATLAGSGVIDANVINAGVVSPGGAGAIGTLTINGSYTQTATGTLDVELSGTAIDQVMVSGAATLAGAVDVSLLGGFKPTAGSLFQVMTFASSSGQFGTVDLPPGLSIVYDPMDVTIKA